MNRFFASACAFGAALLASSFTPARSLGLNTPGWSFSGSGECPDEFSYNCYTGLSGSQVTIVGDDSLTPDTKTTYSYVLDGSESRQKVSFTAWYTLYGSPPISASASLRIGGSTVAAFAPEVAANYSFFWDPGQEFSFVLNNGGVEFFSGELQVSNFSAVLDAPTPVPAPLPVFGAPLMLSWSRRLRRRLRSARG